MSTLAAETSVFQHKIPYNLHRAECWFFLILSIVLISAQENINYLLFALIFILPDSHYPFYIVSRWRKNKSLFRKSMLMYNTTHNLIVWTVFVAIWWSLIGLQWELLAIPIHQFFDRAYNSAFLQRIESPA